MTGVALYVHVPLCLSKCAYCDFTSRAEGSGNVGRIGSALLFQFDHLTRYDLLPDVSSVYIGGGTPTVLGPSLVRLVDGIKERVAVGPDVEFTVETNPDTTHANEAEALVASGVNRFSIGVQSFDDAVLKTLGRRHDAIVAFDAVRTLVSIGARVSLDLMCGIPGQSMASWKSSLATAVSTGVGHVSIYPLTVEDGTALRYAVDAGRMEEPDPDRAAAMMAVAETRLAAAGLERYEVASYARSGQKSQHNTAYWTGVPYIGIGPGASSMLPVEEYARLDDGEGWSHRGKTPAIPEDASRVRFTWTNDIDGFLREPLAAPEDVEFLSRSEALREDLMLGLRMSDGVSRTLVDEASAVNPALVEILDRLVSDDLLVWRRPENDVAERLCPTERGWLLGNEVYGRVWNLE